MSAIFGEKWQAKRAMQGLRTMTLVASGLAKRLSTLLKYGKATHPEKYLKRQQHLYGGYNSLV